MEFFRTFIQTMQNFKFSDAVDIILVAFMIYKLLPLFKSTGTARIATVVITVVVIAWVTGVIKLHTLSWILNQLLAVGLIAVVVLFQPELRRMLDHLGNVKIGNLFGSGKPMQEMEHVIAQTVMACEVMSREKVGALIVFCRDQRLDEYFKTGTQIDGQVSEQLLRNIFFKNSPLHDGAMIIRDSRVAAAGCVLPLSDSHRLSADLGTRHRAGVGMSEASDAVVVIVSEENGTISVASGGMLKRHLAPQTLEKLLRNELCPDTGMENEVNAAAQVLKKITRKKENDGYGKK